jgi:hypothetical protein
VANATGIPADDLLICASHTHSGPSGVLNSLLPAGSGSLDPTLRARFVETIAQTVVAARSRVEPVRLDRSETTVDNVWSNRNDPDAATDRRVRSLQLHRRDGSLLCLVMLIPCHPTILGAWNTDVSADLHGGVRRAVRSRLAERDRDATILTVNGAAGDISTRFARRESSLAEVDRLGALIGEQVAGSLAKSVPVTAGIRSAEVVVELPMRSWDASVALAELEAARAALEALRGNPGTSTAILRQAHTRVQGAVILHEREEPRPVTLNLRTWRLGNELDVLPVPGELFSSIGQQIEASDPEAATWIIGYANGYAGYIPDQAAYDQRTYEALASPYDPSVAAIFLHAANQLLARAAGDS